MSFNKYRSSKIGSYQVILSVDPFVVDSLKERSSSSKFLFDEIKSSRFSTIFNSADSNFIELVHNFSPQDRSGSTVNISMFDPGLNFLNQLFFEFNQKSLRTITNAAQFEERALREYFTDLKNTEKVIRDVSNERQDTVIKSEVEQVQNQLGFIANDLEGFTEFGLNEMLKGYDQTLEEAQQKKAVLTGKIQAEISKRTMPKVYVMYGIGNDLKDWAGPFETFLGDVKHKNDGRHETVQYELVVDYLSDQLSVQIDTLESKSSLFDDGSIPFLVFETRKETKREEGEAGGITPIPDDIRNPFNVDVGLGPGLDSRRFDTKSYTIHDIIVKLLSNYLYKVGIKNHIILLPFLDDMLAGLLERCVLESTSILGVTSFSENTALSGKTGEEKLIYVAQISEFLLKNDVGELLNVIALNRGEEVFPRRDVRNFLRDVGPITESKIKRKFINNVFLKIFNSIGLKSTVAEGDSDKGSPVLMTIDTADDNALYIKIKDPFKRDLHLGTKSYTDPGQGQAGTIEAKQILSIKLGPKYAEVESDTAFRWQDPLREIVHSLNKVSANQTINYDGFFVSDQETKDILIKKFGGGTFPGYAYGYTTQEKPDTGIAVQTPVTKPINDDPFFVFGDRELIRLFLYGGLSTLKATDPEIFDDMSNMVTFAGVPYHVMQRSKGNVGVQDPIWNRLAKSIELLSEDRNNYFEQTYKKLHRTPGYNLGYYLDILGSSEELAFTLPDEFSLDPSDDAATEEERQKLRQLVFDSSFPVFLANTANSNVLSYSFDTNKFIYAQLFGSIRDVYATVAKRFYTEDNPVLEPGMTKEDIALKMVEILDLIGAKSAGIGSTLTTGFGVGKKVDIDEMADLLADLMLLETAGISRKVRKGKGSSIVSFLNMFMDLFSQAYAGSVRTLPMFHLYKHSDLLQQCLVMLKPVRRVKANTNNYADNNRTMDFLSGIYRLTGFTHRIKTSEAYSEFNLFKDLKAELSNAED